MPFNFWLICAITFICLTHGAVTLPVSVFPVPDFDFPANTTEQFCGDHCITRELQTFCRGVSLHPSILFTRLSSTFCRGVKAFLWWFILITRDFETFCRGVTLDISSDNIRTLEFFGRGTFLLEHLRLLWTRTVLTFCRGVQNIQWDFSTRLLSIFCRGIIANFSNLLHFARESRTFCRGVTLIHSADSARTVIDNTQFNTTFCSEINLHHSVRSARCGGHHNCVAVYCSFAGWETTRNCQTFCRGVELPTDYSPDLGDQRNHPYRAAHKQQLLDTFTAYYYNLFIPTICNTPFLSVFCGGTHQIQRTSSGTVFWHILFGNCTLFCYFITVKLLILLSLCGLIFSTERWCGFQSRDSLHFYIHLGRPYIFHWFWQWTRLLYDIGCSCWQVLPLSGPFEQVDIQRWRHYVAVLVPIVFPLHFGAGLVPNPDVILFFYCSGALSCC